MSARGKDKREDAIPRNIIKKMSDIRILGVSTGALLLSSISEMEPALKIIVLVLSIIYTLIGIYKRLKK